MSTSSTGDVFFDTLLLEMQAETRRCRYELAARAGFRLVEVSLPYVESAERLRDEAARHGLRHVLINAPPGDSSKAFRGLAALPDHVDDFEKSLHTAVHYAKTLDCPRVHVMAGITQSPQAASTFTRNIAFAADLFAKEGLECLIEPINSHSIPGYFLDSFSKANDVLATLKKENLKIQFDVFHAQLIQGQITHSLATLKDKIGHIQVAQVPDRHEPDSPGELDYHYIFELLKKTNSEWVVGLEYFPSSNSLDFVERYGLSF